ncbi:MAG: MOSC domain-containing protein [Calditrichia bacterium]
MNSIRLKEIWIYPLKSAGGVKVESGKLVETGLELDRKWALVDEKGGFISQRTLPQLALFKPRILPEGVLMEWGKDTPILLPEYAESMDCATIRIWEDKVVAGDCGNEVAEWFSGRVGQRVRLMVMTPHSRRHADRKYDAARSRLSFSDGYPLLLIGTGSLKDLNDRLSEPVEMSRFRPNLVVECDQPFAEDSWNRVKIGDIVFDVVKPCSRCVITTVDQETGRRSDEPLRTLSRYRKRSGKVWFGQNVVHRSLGIIETGMAVSVLEQKN